MSSVDVEKAARNLTVFLTLTGTEEDTSCEQGDEYIIDWEVRQGRAGQGRGRAGQGRAGQGRRPATRRQMSLPFSPSANLAFLARDDEGFSNFP